MNVYLVTLYNRHRPRTTKVLRIASPNQYEAVDQALKMMNNTTLYGQSISMRTHSHDMWAVWEVEVVGQGRHLQSPDAPAT